MMDAQAQINAILGIRQSFAGRCRAGRADRRTARQCHRQRQSDGLQHGRGAVGERQRHAGGDREGIPGDAGARQSQPRSAAQGLRHRGAAGRHAEIAGAGRRRFQRLQDSPQRTGRQRSRPAHSRRNRQAQCRPRRQRPATRQRRADRDRCLDLADAQGDFAGDHDHAGAGRPDPGRHPRCSSGSMSAATSCGASAACNARCSYLSDGDLESRNLSQQPARRDRGDGEFAGDFPREHDRGPHAGRRSGQGSRRQGRTRHPHGSAHRRIRDHGPRRAGLLAEIRQFDAGHRAEHVGDRRPIQRAGQRGGVRRRGNLGQRPDRIVGHRGTVVVDLRDRPPGRSLRRRSPARRSTKPARPTPPCRASPKTPPASASWSI